MIFVYNGLSRVGGAGSGTLSATPTPFGGQPNVLRLFNEQVGNQIGWLLPLALLGMVVGIFVRQYSSPGWLSWGCWLFGQATVLTFAAGIHPYYTVFLAPPIAVLAGTGLDLLITKWMDKRSYRWLLPVALLGTVTLAIVLLSRGPGGSGLSGIAALAAMVVALVLLLANRIRLIAAITVTAILVAPTIWALRTPAASPDSMFTTNPVAGPALPAQLFGNRNPAITLSMMYGMAIVGRIDLSGPLPGTMADPTLLRFVSGQQGVRYAFATEDASSASPYLALGISVLPMGGFTARTPMPTVAGLITLVRSGQLRYVLQTAAPEMPGAAGQRASWVAAHCARVDGSGLFDCVAAR